MWFDPQRNVIVYETPDARVLQFTHGAKPLTNGYVGVPVTLPNLQIMRLLGYPVIRPLDVYKYDWPRSGIIKAPFHAQTETSNFLTVHPRACVFSDMGTGKTLSALWAADALMLDSESRGETFRALVVAPLSTLSPVWLDSIFANFMSRRKAVILHGSAEKRMSLLAQPADFYLLNHDGIKVGARLTKSRKLEFTSFAGALAARTDIRLVIIDEVGAFRAYRSLRSRVAKTLLARRDFLWMMTGTPIPNGPEDAYGIAMLLNNARGESFTFYRNRVMWQKSQFKWLPKVGANDAAHAMMTPSIRFSLEDCQDMPELLPPQIRDVELTSEQQEHIKTIKKELHLELTKGQVSIANEAAKRTKLIQVSCGAVYMDEDHKAFRIGAPLRMQELASIIADEAEAKVIVYCPFTSVVHMVDEGLKKFTRAVITGETSIKDRNTIIGDFQQKRDPHVLIAQPECISHGPNLTAAATVVWFGPIDKADVFIQANRRIYRPGQRRNCVVLCLAGTAVEREAYKRLEHNESQQGLLLKMVEEQWL